MPGILSRHGKSLFVITALCAAAACTPAPLPLQNGDPAPEVFLKDLYGKTWNLERLRGRVVVLNFWAPWCAPCTKEMPSLQQLADSLRPGDSAVIVTVLYGNDIAQAMAFFKSGGISLPVLVDDDLRVSKRFGVTGVPETYVFDRNLVLRHKVIGPTDFGSAAFASILGGLLKENT